MKTQSLCIYILLFKYVFVNYYILFRFILRHKRRKYPSSLNKMSKSVQIYIHTVFNQILVYTTSLQILFYILTFVSTNIIITVTDCNYYYF